MGCVVKDVSRFGRDYIRVGLCMETMRVHGVRLIAVNDGIDTAKGVFVLVSMLPKKEPKKAEQTAAALPMAANQ